MDKPFTLAPEKSRQGKLGRPVAIVLIASLLLALVSWIGLTVYGENTDNTPQVLENGSFPDTKK